MPESLSLFQIYDFRSWTGVLSFFCGLGVGDWFNVLIQSRGWVGPNVAIRIFSNTLCKLLGLVLFSLFTGAIGSFNAIAIVLSLTVLFAVIFTLRWLNRKKLEGDTKTSAEREVE